MIETLWSYAKRHVAPNWRRIVVTSHPYLSGLLGISVAYNEYGLGERFNIENSFSVFLNYDAVIFGFTATATAITLTISSDKFLKFLSSRTIEGRTAFRAATFILSWNSFVHSLAFMMVFFSENYLLSDLKKSVPSLDAPSKFLLSVDLSLQFYAFFQFVVTNLTLFEVSDLFGQFLHRDARGP